MKSIPMAVVSLLALASTSSPAEEREAGARKPMTPLRIVLTLSRYDGEKKIGSLPYTVQVAANSPNRVRLRMGVEVPVPVTTIATPSQGTGGGSAPQTSFQYRNVGTNIDCSAESLDDGRFSVVVTVEQSSVQSAAEKKPGQADGPMFRTFNAVVPVILRDGQSTQYVSATDPVTGESVRIDLALTVLK